MAPQFENTPLYAMHEMHNLSMVPLRLMASAAKDFYANPFSPISYTNYGRHMAAAGELMERMTRRYKKPGFELESTSIRNRTVAVEDEVVLHKSFCDLRHFKREGAPKGQPKLLIVAPMSGHHATLLRGTVDALLPHAEVYITDWKDAREVPISEGRFDLNTYIDYIVEFLEFIGPGAHTMAVCQPSVPLYAAVAVMSEDKHRCVPKTMTLMGGPIDTRENPTQVNQLAKERSIHWFESQVITRVPFNYPGFMRRVYPGFMQLSGFMTMNLDRHIGEHIKLFQHLIVGDGDGAKAHKKFYNEYLSVCDLTAEFYLQTVQEVFKKHSLPKGEFTHHGRPVHPEKINKTAILCIEGELDDISGVGQTKAAINISSGLDTEMKKYHLQKKVGHYGIFNGRRYREAVRPVITDWIKKWN